MSNSIYIGLISLFNLTNFGFACQYNYMKTETFDVSTFNVKEFDRILSCGLSNGLGIRGSQVCIEAAICQVLGLPHGDDPGCVADSVRRFKIALNDASWSSP